jgi:dTDP-4-dehydrorhamnose reductase
VERERRLTAAYRQALIVRTGPLFAMTSDLDQVTHTIDPHRMSDVSPEPGDAIVSPTYAPDAVDACLDLLIDGEQGVWHVANADATSWPAFVEQVETRLDATPVHRDAPAEEPNAGESVYRALGSERGRLLGPVEDALERHFGMAPLAVEPGALAG